MVVVKVLSAISFDGQRKKSGDEIQMTHKRFEEMKSNFKKQNLEINSFVNLVSIEEIKETVSKEEKPKQKRTRSKK